MSSLWLERLEERCWAGADSQTEKDGVELQIAKETQKLNWYCTLSCLASSCLAFKSRSFMFALVFRYRKGRVDADAAARKLNTSPGTIDDKDALKKMLTTPPVKKIDLHFPLGLEVTARNLKGVTIKDALDAIHKQFKKKVSGCSPSNPCCQPWLPLHNS